MASKKESNYESVRISAKSTTDSTRRKSVTNSS